MTERLYHEYESACLALKVIKGARESNKSMESTYSESKYSTRSGFGKKPKKGMVYLRLRGHGYDSLYGKCDTVHGGYHSHDV